MRVSISTTQQPVSVPAVAAAAAATTTTTTTTTATTTVDSGVSTGPILAPAPKTYKPRRHTKSITEERAIKIYTEHYCTPPPPHHPRNRNPHETPRLVGTACCLKTEKKKKERDRDRRQEGEREGQSERKKEREREKMCGDVQM